MVSNNHSLSIVTTKEKRVEVIACPGSGKTFTLVKRLQHLLNNKVPAKKILVLSFSTASVLEIRRRLEVLDNEVDSSASTKQCKSKKAISIDYSEVCIQTTHGFSFGLLRGQSKKLTLLKNVEIMLGLVLLSILEDTQKGKLWEDKSEIIRNKRIKQIEELLASVLIRKVLDLLNYARSAKKKLSKVIALDRFVEIKPYFNVLLEVRRRYSLLKQKQQVMDFADMLDKAIKIIDSHPESMPYTHILVDEYQDCSAAQVALLVKMANLAGRSLMVFGDKKQAIYGFSGASYISLSSVLENVKQLSLPFSRRLTAQTSALASSVAKLSDSAIQTSRTGAMPVLVKTPSSATQTQSIVSTIQTLIAGGVASENIVVLARIKSLLNPVEKALLARQVATRQMGLTRDQNHALLVLKLVGLLERVESSKESMNLLKLSSILPDFPISEKMSKRLILLLKKGLLIPSLEGRYILCAQVYLKYLGGVRANKELRADVNRWEPVCRKYTRSHQMIKEIQQMNTSAVVTGSIHAAKGGEWDYVFIVGVTEGLLPLYLSRGELELEEDRNLLYVAITRAKEAVRLYHAPTNHARSRRTYPSLSQFLEPKSVQQCLDIENHSISTK